MSSRPHIYAESFHRWFLPSSWRLAISCDGLESPSHSPGEPAPLPSSSYHSSNPRLIKELQPDLLCAPCYEAALGSGSMLCLIENPQTVTVALLLLLRWVHEIPLSSTGGFSNFNFFAPSRLTFRLPSHLQFHQRDLRLPHPSLILYDVSCILDVRSPAPLVCFSMFCGRRSCESDVVDVRGGPEEADEIFVGVGIVPGAVTGDVLEYLEQDFRWESCDVGHCSVSWDG